MSDLFDTPAEYRLKRSTLMRQMKNRHNLGVSLKKNTSNLFRTRQQTGKRLDVRNLNHVIKVDPKKLVVEVEGMTTYETLVASTLQYGCLPTVVPELNTITIGGALAGVGIESSSFRYGLVHETVQEIEVLLSDGQVVTASPTIRPDLFYGLPNTFGTLGYVLKLKVQLIKAKSYVHLRHIPFSDSAKLFETIEQITKTSSFKGETVDFMDASVFAPNRQFLTLGSFADDSPYTSDYTYMKMYYRSIQQRQEDYLTTHDYIWRWDADWFWCSDRFGADKWPIRLLFGKWLLKSRSYWKIVRWDRKYSLGARWQRLARRQTNRESVIQDVQVPVSKAPEFLKFLHDKIGILPIWVCPTKSLNPKAHFSFFPLGSEQLYINFGFWDFVETTKDPAKGYYNRLIEHKLEQIGGSKGLYSDSYYSQIEFWQIYDHPAYEKLKAKYDPEHSLKDLYTKTVVRE